MKRAELLLLLVFIFLLSFLAIFSPKLISIKNIKCQSQYGPCNTLINKSISEVEMGNLRLTNRKLKDVLKINIFVKEYRVRYIYPDKLYADIIERNPRFSLLDSSLNKYFLIDGSGLVLSAVDESNLPKLTINSMVKEGEMVSREQLFALNILEQIYSSYTPNSAKIEKNHLIVELEDGVKIIFPLEGDRNLLVGSMFFIMSKVKGGEVGGSKVAIIDLQYKSPVLTLK